MREPTGRPEWWRAEFERQSTSDMRERLYRAARARLRMYAGRSRHVDDADVDDIVMGVIVDTLDNLLTWDPETQTLERHMLDAIAFRVRDQARAKARHAHELYDEEVHGESLPCHLIDDAYEGLDLRVIADQVVLDMQMRADGDPQILELMELFADGVTERAEGIRVSTMCATEFDNAVRRLRRLTKQLPKPTRDAVLEALT